MLRRTPSTLIFTCFALLFGPFLTGCGRQIERSAERKLNDLLPDLIGPAEGYSTRVRGGGSLLQGRARGVHVDGRGVRVDGNLTLDTVALDLANVEADTRTGQIRRIESVAFGATLGEENLRRYVLSRRPNIPELRVGLGTDAFVVSARPELLGVASLPVRVSGILTPRANGTLLDFTPSGARVAIVPIPGPVLRYLADRLNPVLDLSTLRIPVRVKRAEVRQGRLHLTGSVDPAEVIRLSGSLPVRGSSAGPRATVKAP